MLSRPAQGSVRGPLLREDETGRVTAGLTKGSHTLCPTTNQQLWLTDITEHRTAEGKLYVCAVKDVHSNRIVGYSIDSRMKSRLAVTAIDNAVARRAADGAEVAGCIMQSAQYTSYEVGKALRASGLLASMGRVVSAFENAMAESVFATSKTELIYRRSWPTRHELEMEVFSYLEGFYNTRRRHSRLGNLSPTDYETTHLTQNEVSA
jgi:putative transposase